MKFRFKNLGPIKEANLELGDLTIIAGRNNTGKTYLAYALYGFLKRWRWWPEAGLVLGEENEKTGNGEIPRLLLAAAEKGQVSITVDPQTIDQERLKVIEVLTRHFSKSELASVFSAPRDRFEGAALSIELCSGFPLNYTPIEIQSPSQHYYRAHYNDDNIIFSVDPPPKQISETSEALIYLTVLYLNFLFPELRINPFVLSSERFGVSLFYRELDFTKNRLVDLLQKLSDDGVRRTIDPFLLIDRTTSRYALPVKDNIDYTRSIPDLQGQRSELYEYKLVKELRRMTKGYYKSAGDSIAFMSTARGSRRFSIPLNLASSSVRGLSDLHFFLQHVARHEHLLIIDEPESHLDTNNQILMARLLVRCVHAGLKVLITTHSDYLVKELNNLIMLSRDFDGKEDLLKKLNYDPEDALDPGHVRAYVAENGTLTACSVDRYGMEMPNFDSTIDDINRVTNEISSRIFETDGL